LKTGIDRIKEALIKQVFVVPAKAGIQDTQNGTGSPPPRGRLDQRFLNRIYRIYKIRSNYNSKTAVRVWFLFDPVNLVNPVH
jgi:hypothetical protein